MVVIVLPNNLIPMLLPMNALWSTHRLIALQKKVVLMKSSSIGRLDCMHTGNLEIIRFSCFFTVLLLLFPGVKNLCGKSLIQKKFTSSNILTFSLHSLFFLKSFIIWSKKQRYVPLPCVGKLKKKFVPSM